MQSIAALGQLNSDEGHGLQQAGEKVLFGADGIPSAAKADFIAKHLRTA